MLNIPWSECSTVYPFTSEGTPRLLPSFGNYEYSCCKHPCAGFCVGVSFQLISTHTHTHTHTKDHDCWIRRGCLVLKKSKAKLSNWPYHICIPISMNESSCSHVLTSVWWRQCSELLPSIGYAVILVCISMMMYV